MKKDNYINLIVFFITIFLVFYIQLSCSKGPVRSLASVNYAVSFDGLDDCIIINAKNTKLDSISTELTIESWIYIKSFPNRAPRIIDRSDNKKSGPLGDRIVFALFEPDSSVHLNINGYSTRSNPLPLNEWIHVAGTYNSEEIKIFVNGDSINSTIHQDRIDVTLSDLYIGNDDSLTNRQFDGYLDEIRIWNKCLDKVQIRYTMDKILTGKEAGLICYWRFNEGSGQIVLDKSLNNIHGYLGSSEHPDDSDPVWIECDFPYDY